MSHERRSRTTIRDRRAEDIEPIVDLALESLTWHAEAFDDIRPAPQRAALLHSFQELETTSDTYFRVAETDIGIAGFLSASLQPPTKGGIEALDITSVYISDIVVTKSARRRGIARALLNDLDHWASDHGCATIRLNMHAGNEPAQRLYEELGYRASWITYRKDRDNANE